MTPRPAPRTTPKTFSTGSILPIAALLIAGSTITLASLGSMGVFRSANTASEREQSLPPTPIELAACLARVGVNPESLTAAGVDTAGAARVVANTRSHLDAEHLSDLIAADDAWKTASQDAERLGKLVRSGQSTGEDVTALRQAETTLQNASARRDAELAALRTAATAALSRDQTQALARIEANSAYGLDTPFLVNDRSQADWVALRDALANIKTSVKSGEDPDNSCSQRVTQANAESEVAAARSYINTRLPQVRDAFELALEG